MADLPRSGPRRPLTNFGRPVDSFGVCDRGPGTIRSICFRLAEAKLRDRARSSARAVR